MSFYWSNRTHRNNSESHVKVLIVSKNIMIYFKFFMKLDFSYLIWYHIIEAHFQIIKSIHIIK